MTNFDLALNLSLKNRTRTWMNRLIETKSVSSAWKSLINVILIEHDIFTAFVQLFDDSQTKCQPQFEYD